MKRLAALCLATALAAVSLSGCRQPVKMEKYQYQFFDTFDTLIQIVGYTETIEDFNIYAAQARNRFEELDAMFDKFELHEGVGGIAAINAAAGRSPVKAEPEVLALLELVLEWQDKTHGAVDVTMGPVISVWQSYLSRYGQGNPDAVLPSQAELEAARALCGRQFLEIDQQAGTVYLNREGASLDVGAVAKGYATELVAQELEASGWNSFSISSGGNVRASGEPKNDQTNAWGVGIQDPFAGAVLANENQILDVLFINGTSVVTSGDYQRFYMVGERRVHHLIDPSTLYPAEGYRSVTVVTPDSGLADLLSTALFILDMDRGRALAEEYDVGVLWVLPDGSVEANERIIPLLRDRGGASNRR